VIPVITMTGHDGALMMYLIVAVKLKALFARHNQQNSVRKKKTLPAQ
jgi:hypothetical protein